jgi:hypothetical protein
MFTGFGFYMFELSMYYITSINLLLNTVSEYENLTLLTTKPATTLDPNPVSPT